MGIEDDILKLVKNEGFLINETIKDALDEFLDVINEENDGMEGDLDDEGGTGDVEDD